MDLESIVYSRQHDITTALAPAFRGEVSGKQDRAKQPMLPRKFGSVNSYSEISGEKGKDSTKRNGKQQRVPEIRLLKGEAG